MSKTIGAIVCVSAALAASGALAQEKPNFMVPGDNATAGASERRPAEGHRGGKPGSRQGRSGSQADGGRPADARPRRLGDAHAPECGRAEGHRRRQVISLIKTSMTSGTGRSIHSLRPVAFCRACVGAILWRRSVQRSQRERTLAFGFTVPERWPRHTPRALPVAAPAEGHHPIDVRRRRSPR